VQVKNTEFNWLMVSETADAETIVVTFDSSDLFDHMYFELFAYVDSWLRSGRVEKDKLKDLARSGLEDFRDLREDSDGLVR